MKNNLNINCSLKSDNVRLPYVYAFFALISILVYFNALRAGFLYDDKFFVVRNLYIRNLKFIPQIFKTDVFHFAPSPSSYYRPIQMLSYLFDYNLWKLNPSGYHLTNIAIHSLNSFLVYLLIILIFKDRLLALLSAVFFCIHPIQIGVVTVIGGRSNILEMMFMLLSLISLVRYYRDNRLPEYLLALFLFILAVLSREGALLTPFFIILCGLSLNVDRKRLFLTFLPFLAICGLYLFLRAHFLPSDKLKIEGILSWPKITAFFYFAQSYIAQLILPYGLAIKILPQKAAFSLVMFPLSCAFILASAALIISKDRVALFGSAFYLLGLLPVLNLLGNIFFLGRVLSEPYVYPASVGFFIIAGRILSKFYNRFPKPGLEAVALVTLSYACLTAANNLNYKDETRFYNYVLSVDRNNTIAHLNLGNIYFGKKMFAQAEREARIVLGIEPDAWDAYLLLGNISREKGDLGEAAKMYRLASLLNPDSIEALNNLGLVYRAQGSVDKAIATFKMAIAINPEAVTAMQNLADIFIAAKSYNEALALCVRILKLDPGDISCRVKTGIILAESGRIRQAESAFKEALELDPNSVEALRNIGVFYANSGDLNKAISVWKQALSINPDDRESRKNIEQAQAIIKSGRINSR
jgi:tetratricopeptide (TPR) repeat protein